MILCEMEGIAFSPIAIIGVCMFVCTCVCVHVYVRMPRWSTSRKRLEINPTVSNHLVGHEKIRPTTYLATFYLMTLTYFLKVKDYNRANFCRLYVVISQTVKESKLSYCNTWEVVFLHSNGVYTFDIGQL